MRNVHDMFAAGIHVDREAMRTGGMKSETAIKRAARVRHYASEGVVF